MARVDAALPVGEGKATPTPGSPCLLHRTELLLPGGEKKTGFRGSVLDQFF